MSLREDLLEEYQIRKTKEQKSAFIKYVREFAEEKGYRVSVEGKGDEVRNIVIGDVKSARVVYTAHYDTPPVMPVPNFITPKSIVIYVLYQILVIALMLIIPMGVAFFLSGFVPSLADGAVPPIIFLVLYYAELYLMMFGPANKHNANDNTSGVATVLGIAESLCERGLPVAFILFDCEERGLLGSKTYNKQNKQMMQDKLVVNFDCVSDGEYMMFIGRKNGRERMSEIEKAFPSADGITCLYETRGVVYPSDQNSFPTSIGVASMRRTRGGLLYTGRIHTSRDTVFCERNLDFLISGAVRLAEGLEVSESTPC